MIVETYYIWEPGMDRVCQSPTLPASYKAKPGARIFRAQVVLPDLPTSVPIEETKSRPVEVIDVKPLDDR